MNDEHDGLEQELRSLRPVHPTDELEARVAAELDVQPAAKIAKTARWYVAVGGGLALAGLIALALGRRSPVEVPPPEVGPWLPAVAALDPSLPSVWAYHRAVVDSDVEIEELLDRQQDREQLAAARREPALVVSSLTQVLRMGDL